MRRLRRNPELRPSPWGKNLAGMDLSGQNLSYMDLSGAHFESTKLIDADLSGADLRGANLSGAKLIAANLSGADVGDANLTGANFIGADLSSAKLAGADLTRANVILSNLSGANLTGANLSGADLTNTDLKGAELTHVKLIDADLTRANLTDANLTGANLTGADFTGANLRGANRTGVDLTHARNMPRIGPLREHYAVRSTDSPAFKRWFGDSVVVVGDDKKPVVVYHGTIGGGFTQFDPSKSGSHQAAFYLTDSMDVAETYVDRSQPASWPDPAAEPGKKSGIYRLYIKLVNPMVIEGQGRHWNQLIDPRAPDLRKTYELTRWAQAHGHDGVIFKNILDGGGHGPYRGVTPATVYAVFDPRAIKSATANNGNFDPNDADIRHNPRHLRRRR